MPEDAFQESEDDTSDAEDEPLVILPENADTIQVFRAVERQWRLLMPPMGGKCQWIGLRYSEVESTINMLGLAKRQTEIFAGIIDMERAALPILNG